MMKKMFGFLRARALESDQDRDATFVHLPSPTWPWTGYVVPLRQHSFICRNSSAFQISHMLPAADTQEVLCCFLRVSLPSSWTKCSSVFLQGCDTFFILFPGVGWVEDGGVTTFLIFENSFKLENFLIVHSKTSKMLVLHVCLAED